MLRSAPGAFRGSLFTVPKDPRTLFQSSARAFSGLPVVLEVAWGVADMIYAGCIVHLGIDGDNQRGLSPIVSVTVRFFPGVGGSGRSPIESAAPEGRGVRVNPETKGKRLVF